jgi:hypothetical protein
MAKLEMGEAFKIAGDRAGYVRRECGSCHRIFKVRAGERDAGALQRALGARLLHANAEEFQHHAPMTRHCPYCQHQAPEEAWFTSAQRAHVEKRADHFQREVRFQQLNQPRRQLDDNPYLTFLPVEPEPFDAELAETGEASRPFPLVCCKEELRLQSSWSGSVSCFFCGTEHEIPRIAPGLFERLGGSDSDF